MQSLQSDRPSPPVENQAFLFDDLNESVSDFLADCHLSRYLPVFMEEGFDSIESLLEITEDDMIEMEIKRGHRRLIQREIAAYKGVPRDQPIMANVMGSKYPNDFTSLKIEHPRISYDRPIMTGLTSPMSMSSSGIGGSTTASSTTPNTSGNNSSGSSGSGSNIAMHHHHHHASNKGDRFRLQQQHQQQQQQQQQQQHQLQQNQQQQPKHHQQQLQETENQQSPSSQAYNNEANNSNNSSNSSNDDDDSTVSTFAPLKRKYRHHPKPDRNAPIKPPSAYIMFSNDFRTRAIDQNLSFAELAKIVGDQWKNLSHNEKRSYERMAALAKDEYLAALEIYEKTPEYRKYQEYLKEFKEKQATSNSALNRARKKSKQKLTDSSSGSLADASSNGNSNGSGSSGSGSTDIYGDQEAVIQRQQRAASSNKNIRRTHYTPPAQKSRARYPNTRNTSTEPHEWDYRSSQMMRGIIPVEFINTEPPAINSNASSVTSNDES